jgi:superfamily II DNA or RNA helicase
MMELRPHQKEALSKLDSGKILAGGVGSGKSMVACAFYVQRYPGRDVYVITTAKKRDSLDWQREFARFSVGMDEDATIAGILTIDSWNNIHKFENIQGAFFIFDEQRLVGSGGWVKSFLKIARNNTWIMLSATPGDSWLDFIPVFIANGFYKNRTEFKARHVIYKSFTKFPSVDRYVEVGKLVRYRNAILVKMPFDKHTKRHTVILPVDHDVEMMKRVMKDRWNPFEDRPIKRSSDLYFAMRKVVSTHESRLEALKKVMEKHPRIIVFYNFNYELEMLRNIEGIQISEWNGHKHDEVPDTPRWLYLVQYTAGSEGWECITTNTTFFWSQDYSYKRTEQAYGRIDRLNTVFIDLFYYLPMSNAYIDKAIRRSFKEKRDFNEHDMSVLS